MIEGLLVVGKEVEQVDTDDGTLFLRRWNDALKFIVVALKHTDVAFEFFDVLKL